MGELAFGVVAEGSAYRIEVVETEVSRDSFVNTFTKLVSRHGAPSASLLAIMLESYTSEIEDVRHTLEMFDKLTGVPREAKKKADHSAWNGAAFSRHCMFVMGRLEGQESWEKCCGRPEGPPPTPSARVASHTGPRHIQVAADALAGRYPRRATVGGMGSINPEREARRRWRPTDPLRLLEWGFVLTARCQRAGCYHARELPVSLLIEAYGPDATLEQIAAHMRCSKCEMQGARIIVRYVARRCEGR